MQNYPPPGNQTNFVNFSASTITLPSNNDYGPYNICTSTSGKFIYILSWYAFSGGKYTDRIQYIDLSNNQSGISTLNFSTLDKSDTYPTSCQSHIVCDPTGQVVVASDYSVGNNCLKLMLSNNYGRTFSYISKFTYPSWITSAPQFGDIRVIDINTMYLFGTIKTSGVTYSGGGALYKITNLNTWITGGTSNSAPTISVVFNDTNYFLINSYQMVAYFSSSINEQNMYMFSKRLSDQNFNALCYSTNTGTSWQTVSGQLPTTTLTNINKDGPSIMCDSTGQYVAIGQTGWGLITGSNGSTHPYASFGLRTTAILSEYVGLFLSNDNGSSFKNIVPAPTLVSNVSFGTNSSNGKTYLGAICVLPSTATTIYYYILIGSVTTGKSIWTFNKGNINSTGINSCTSNISVGPNLPVTISISPDGTVATVVCTAPGTSPMTSSMYNISLSAY